MVLFYSKIRDAMKCPRLYYWIHHKCLVVRQSPPTLERGRLVHKLLQLGLPKSPGEPLEQEAWETILPETPLPLQEEVASLGLQLQEQLRHLEWDTAHSEVLLAQVRGDYTWLGKADLILEHRGKVWLGELKTTKVSPRRVAQLYFSEPQPWLYMRLAQEQYENVGGIKVIVVTPKEGITETIPLTQRFLEMVEEFQQHSEHYIGVLVREGVFPKNRFNCLSLMGECPYRVLCTSAEGAIAELCEAGYFIQEDPLLHLFGDLLGERR